MDAVDALEDAEAADVAGAAVGAESPLTFLVAAREDAVDVEPHRVRAHGNAHDAQGDAHLDRPAVGRAGDGGFPRRVPVGGEVGVVEVEGVELLPGRVDLEMVCGAAVERGVQVELDAVALDVAVAAGEGGDGRLVVVADGAEVVVLVVPEDAEGGVYARGLALVGVDLREAVLERRGLPGGLVHAAVDDDGPAHTASRVRGAHEGRLWRQRFFRLRACGPGSCQGHEREQGGAHVGVSNG